MTKFSFKTKSSEAERLFAILQAYGVEDLQVDFGNETLNISIDELKEVELGIREANEGILISDEEVQREAHRICMK